MYIGMYVQTNVHLSFVMAGEDWSNKGILNVPYHTSPKWHDAMQCNAIPIDKNLGVPDLCHIMAQCVALYHVKKYARVHLI